MTARDLESLRNDIERLQDEIVKRHNDFVTEALDVFTNVSEDELEGIMSIGDRIVDSEKSFSQLQDIIDDTASTQQQIDEAKKKQLRIQQRINDLEEEFEERTRGQKYSDVRSELDNLKDKRANNAADDAQTKRKLRQMQITEKEEAKEEKKQLKKAQKITKLFSALEQVVKVAFQWANTLAENELSRVKEINDIQKNALQATQKIASTQIKLAGTLFGNSLKTAFASITEGPNAGAYAAASNQVSEVQQAKTASMDIEMERVRAANKQSMRTKQGQNDRKDRTEATIGATIAAGVAVGAALGSFLPGVGNAVGAIIGGVAGLLVTGVNELINYRKEQRRREAEFMQANYELSEAQLENMQQIQKSAMDSAFEMVKAAQEFSQKIEDAVLQMDDAYRKTGASMGLHGQNLVAYTKHMIDVQKNVSWVGGEDADKKIAQMQRNYNETTGYANNLSLNDIQKNLSLGVALDDQALADNLTSAMEYFNKSVSDSSDIFYEMYTRANKAGLSSKKYAKDLQQNLKLAQKYTFQGGAKGMMEMSLWAQKVRFNVQSLGGMLDKINEGGLEGAITQAAQLQVLGGSAAMGADPLAMAWEARNDPEAYAKRMYNMTKDYGIIDETTGEVDTRGLNGMMLEQIAKAQGRSFEDVRAEVAQRGKMEAIDRQLTANYTDQQKQLIYSKAKYNTDTQQWEYTTADGQVKGINDLGNGDFDFVELLPTEERIEDHVKNILTLLQQSSGAKGEANTMLASGVYDSTAANVQERNQETVNNVNQNYSKLIDLITTQQDRATEALQESNTRLANSLDIVKETNDYLREEAAKLNKSMPEQLETLKLSISAMKGNTSAIEKLQLRATGLDSLSDAQKQRMESIIGEKAEVTEGANGRKSYILKDKDASNLFSLLGNATGTERTEIVKKLSKKGFGSNYEEIRQFYDYLNLYKNGVQNSVNDGIATSVGSGQNMFTHAANVTPINDGAVSIAKSHPDDTALFAKTGGPFDTLFNGVFGEISAVHRTMREALQPKPLPLQREVVSDYSPRVMQAMSLGGGQQQYNPNTGNGNQSIDVNINGKLELTGEKGSGATLDILNELSTNPMFVRALTQLISEEMSRTINGGKANSQY